MSADTPATPASRPLPLDEAARALGISRRTVQRRLATGELRGRKVGQRWTVDVPATTPGAAQAQDRARQVDLERLARQADLLGRECDTLRAQVSDLERELAHARERIADLEVDREHWRNAAAAALAVRALLAESTERGRSWWQVWRR